MTTNTFNPHLTPTVLRDIAGKLKSGAISPADILGFDLGATLKKKPADDRPAFADDPAALKAFEVEFCQFWLLMAANPDTPIVPTEMQDEWGWHQFLLKPFAYHESSWAWAGQIIDHEGGFGLGEGERPILEGYFSATKRLWEETYGEPHPADLTSVTDDATGATCKGQGGNCFTGNKSHIAATCKGQGGKCWTGARTATRKRQSSQCIGRAANCHPLPSRIGMVAATCLKQANVN